MPAIVVAILGDLHVNSFVGLAPPYFEWQGGKRRQNDAQRWSWRRYLEFIQRVQTLAEQNDAEVLTIWNGDLCDMHHKTTALVVQAPMTMLRMTYDVMRPLVELSRWNYVVDGTMSHTRSLEDKIGEDIGAVENEAEKAWSWRRLKLDVNGVHIWAAHHTGMGRLPWTRYNVANRIAAQTVFACADSGERLPDVVFRSHQHRWADSYDNYKVRAICLPAWQLPTEYIATIDPDGRPELGGAIMICQDGHYVLEKFRASPRAAAALQVVS